MELELRVYDCPIDVRIFDDHVEILSYTIFGNLDQVVKQMERLRYEEPKSDVYYRTSVNSDEVYLCRRMKTERYGFYDPIERRKFLLPSIDVSLRINFLTFDEERGKRWHELKRNSIDELWCARRRYAERKALLLSFGILGGISSSIFFLEYVLSGDLSFVYLFGPLCATGLLAGYLQKRIVSSDDKRAATLSIIEEEIRGGENVRCVEHPELRDIYEALRDVRELDLPEAYTDETRNVFREVKKRLKDRGNPWTLNLYAQKIGP